MDDIYGDLENYEEVNVVDELRNENSDLKLKLKEYAATMDKLQKDFDKLSSDFHKLEINYSSLLRTARAEIERKTLLITNLNKEKDMMVLNSIQSSNTNLLNISRNVRQDRSNNVNRSRVIDPGIKSSRNTKELLEPTLYNLERIEDNRKTSEAAATSVNIDETTKMAADINVKKDKTYEGKENVTKTKTRAQSIRNRRKSMPVLGKNFGRFSTDEEDNYSEEEVNKKEEAIRSFLTKNYSEKHKVSETSGIDDKYSRYHESFRETYYKSKQRHSDKFRSREKYEPTSRYRRQKSLERSHRSLKDSSKEGLRRPEHGRYRVLESPPTYRFNSQRRNRDRRSNHDDNPYERPRSRHDRYLVKHKTHSDHDEPSNKRARLDSQSRLVDDDRRRQIDHGVIEETTVSRSLEHLRHTSCQSPDFSHGETLDSSPVKEIMNTAATLLEDPRVTSIRYTARTEDNGVVFSAITGTDVVLKIIDSSSWEIERVDVPEALRRPPKSEKELINEIYMDIENPANGSIESGEIYSDNYDIHDTDAITASKVIDNVDVNKQVNFTEEKPEHNKTDDTYKALPSKYKIPKVKRSDNGCDSTPVKDLPKPLATLIMECIDDKASLKADDKNAETKKTTSKHVEKPVHVAFEKDYEKPINHFIREQRALSNREVVEGDLELSDENSDFVENVMMHSSENNKEQLSEKILSTRTKISTRKFSNDNQTVSTPPTARRARPVIKGSWSLIDTPEKSQYDLQSTVDAVGKSETGISATEKKTEEISSNFCKITTRRKVHKLKLTKQDTATTETNKGKDKKSKAKKDKEMKLKEMKPKFNDLFGDSLITLEDLGVPLSPKVSTSKYVPINEDAQDATDVNVEENRKKQTVLPKVDAVIESPKDATEEYSYPKTSEVNKDESIPTMAKEATDVSTEEARETSNMYVNLNTDAVTKEPDVVKTVVISTGVQPQYVVETTVSNFEHIIINNDENIDKVASLNTIFPKIQDVAIQALATSTPHKELQLKNVLGHTDIIQPESSFNSNYNRIVKNDVSSPGDQSSMSNGLQHHSDVDVPDVRIFVKRRRKVVKK